MTKAPGQTAYEAWWKAKLYPRPLVLTYWENLDESERAAWAAAEAASAAKAVEPWELLVNHIANKGGSLDCLPAAPDGCVFLFCNDKQSTNAPPTEAARSLCIQLGLLPPESGK